MTNRSNLNTMAAAVNAALVVIEHRYWGASSPFDDLNNENLQWLTLEQNIADLNYFAQAVALPFDTARTSALNKAPWFLYGVSYSGAVSAWVAATAPGTFFGYVSLQLR